MKITDVKATTVKTGKEFNEQEMKEITNITNGLNKNTAIKKHNTCNITDFLKRLILLSCERNSHTKTPVIIGVKK